MASQEGQSKPPDQYTLSRRNFLEGAFAGALAAGPIGWWFGQTVSQQPDPRLVVLNDAVGKLPVPAEYTPSFQEKRPIVALSKEQFPVVPIHSTEEFFSRVKDDLAILITRVAERQSDPDVNPDLSALPWFIYTSGLDYFQPPTLLTLLRDLQNDLNKGFVELEKVTDPSYSPMAAVRSVYRTGDKAPFIWRTVISFNTRAIAQETYPGLDNPSLRVPITNLNLLLILFYEYGNRFQDIWIITYLNKVGFFNQFPVYSEAEAAKVIDDFKALMKQEKAFRFSAAQNYMQMALHRSIAALAGDSNGKVRGLERNENWQPYKFFLAALNGDAHAMHLLSYHLSTGANY